jgi:hypothetical protein
MSKDNRKPISRGPGTVENELLMNTIKEVTVKADIMWSMYFAYVYDISFIRKLVILVHNIILQNGGYSIKPYPPLLLSLMIYY